MDRESFRQFLINKAIKFNEGTRPDGNPATWMLDNREAIYHNTASVFVVEAVNFIMDDNNCSIIAGPGSAANGLIGALILKGKRGLHIRKEPKNNQLRKIIEGSFEPGEEVMIFDDIINSGNNMYHCIDTLKQAGLIVKGIITLVNFNNRGYKNLVSDGYNVHVIFEKNELGPKKKTPEPDYPDRKWIMHDVNLWDVVVPRSSPIKYKNTILFGTNESKFYCLGMDGTEKWVYDCKSEHKKGILSSPAIYKDRVYFGAYTGHLFCLEAETGREVWKKKICSWVGSSPWIDDDRIYVGTEYKNCTGSLMCLNLEGEILWEVTTDNLIHCSPIVHNGIAVIGSNDFSVLGADAKTGRLLWKNNIGTETKAGFAAEDGKLYFGSHDGKVRCWNIKTGKPVWERKIASWIFSTPEIYNDKVIISTVSSRIFALDKSTGTISWYNNTKEKCFSFTRTENGKTYCGSGDGCLYVIDAETGHLEKRFFIGGEILTRPLINGKDIIIGSRGRYTCV